MARKESPVRFLLNPKRIIIPIFFGLGVAVWLLITNFNKEAFSLVDWSWRTLFWIVMAILMMVIRDIAYMYRIRVLTGYELSWRKAFDVILLWEFASAVTPSVVGGTPIAVFLVNREGINVGRSATIVLITSFLDELFFISMVPILSLLLIHRDLFPFESSTSVFSIAMGTKLIFLSSYSLILMYSLLIAYALFINPEGVKRFLLAVFSLPVLKKWQDTTLKTANELITASKEIKSKPLNFWVKAAGSTFLSWTARYMVINCLIMAFVFTDEHVLIYGRQLVMWVIMLISPTPGGSGLAEYVFSVYLHEFIPSGLESTLAFVWRLISYYPYLFIGTILLPVWVRRVYIKRKLIKFKRV